MLAAPKVSPSVAINPGHIIVTNFVVMCSMIDLSVVKVNMLPRYMKRLVFLTFRHS